MADVSDFRNWVEVGCEGAPRTLVDAAILRACERFLRYSGLWSVEHAPVQLVDAQAAYTITLPTGAQLCRVEAVHYKGQPLGIGSNSAWAARYTGGFANYAFWVESPDQLILAPTPSGTFTADDTLTFRAVFTTAPDAATVPQFLADEYADEIADGALATLFRIPGKGWSDFNEAKARDKAFMAGAAHAKIRAATGNTNSILPPDYPRTA
jgi:ligand-binding SRPBCC domain-containing protein